MDRLPLNRLYSRRELGKRGIAMGYRAVEHALAPTACVDAFNVQEQEERDFHVATDTELDNAEARELGVVDRTCEYVLTDRDVWHKNPYYTGKPGRHPEDDHYDEDEDERPVTRPSTGFWNKATTTLDCPF